MLDVGRPPVAILDQFPKLQSYYNHMKALPRIAAYRNSSRRVPYKIPYMPKDDPNAQKI